MNVMTFEQFRAKVFMLNVLKEMDQPLDDLIEEITNEFGYAELEGLKILVKNM